MYIKYIPPINWFDLVRSNSLLALSIRGFGGVGSGGRHRLGMVWLKDAPWHRTSKRGRRNQHQRCPLDGFYWYIWIQTTFLNQNNVVLVPASSFGHPNTNCFFLHVMSNSSWICPTRVGQNRRVLQGSGSVSALVQGIFKTPLDDIDAAMGVDTIQSG